MKHSGIDLESLRDLAVVASACHFGRAARLLNVAPSTISRRIAHLEAELGLTLFERNRSGIRLTIGGERVLVHVRRALADIEAIKTSGKYNGIGDVGELRLGMRMPIIGGPLRELLEKWRIQHPKVDLAFFEMNEHEIRIAIEDHRLDAAFIANHTLWPQAAFAPLFREKLLIALPEAHPLTSHATLNWNDLQGESVLVQGWEDSQATREFYSSLLGNDVYYKTHAASKQAILGLVGAGYGITLVTLSQSEVHIPGVVFRSVDMKDASLEVELIWDPHREEAVIGRFVAFMRDEARNNGY